MRVWCVRIWGRGARARVESVERACVFVPAGLCVRACACLERACVYVPAGVCVRVWSVGACFLPAGGRVCEYMSGAWVRFVPCVSGACVRICAGRGVRARVRVWSVRAYLWVRGCVGAWVCGVWVCARACVRVSVRDPASMLVRVRAVSE